MKKLTKIISIIILSIVILSIVFISTEAKDVKRSYFKVKSDAGKYLIKDIKKHEFKNNIVSVETSKKNIENLKKNKNLEFIGDAIVYKPLQIYNRPLKIPPSPGRSSSKSTINRVCKLTDYNLPQINYGIKYMYEDPNLVKPSGGRNVKVAILDTGVNISHPDIVNRVKYCKDVTTNPESNTCDDSSTIPAGHGTLVASIVAADSGSDNLGMYGVAPEADIYAIKVCISESCYDDDLAAGIYDAVNNGANIISMSIGGIGLNPVVKDALDYAYDNNVLLIAAAGNYFGTYPNVNTINDPAAYYRVISVGAINPDYTTWLSSARGINDGDYFREEREIEFGAPGTVILAASKDGCYSYGGGTSLAAPHVAGLAAKLWRGDASTTRLLMQRSATLHDLDVFGDDTATGFGLPTIRIPEGEYPPININPWNELPRQNKPLGGN